MWVPFIRDKLPHYTSSSDPHDKMTCITIDRYSARPWEKELSNLIDDVWYYDPESHSLWLARFDRCMLSIEYNSFYQDGEEVSVGGYDKESKRWVELNLYGPYAPGDLLIKPVRKAGLLLAHFTAPKTHHP